MKLPLKLNNENDIYYNVKKCCSYNYFMNIIVGGRGIGKTTSWCIQTLLECNKGYEFIYMRRYKPELQEFVSKDTLGKICDGIGYKGGKDGVEFFRENTKLGYGITLATANKYKSADFSKVKTIIFDEAVLPRGSMYRYLKDEMFMILEFISTVFRTRTDGRVVILGNNMDIFNPFFAYFDIPLFDTIYTNKERGIYCELAKNSPKLLEMEKKTGLYNLTKGTNYGDYHYDNKVLSSSNAKVINNKPNGARILCRTVINDYTLTYYLFNDINNDLNIYCEFRNKKIKDNISYTLIEDNKINYTFVNEFRSKFRSFFARKYDDDKFYFDSEKGGQIYQWLRERV